MATDTFHCPHCGAMLRYSTRLQPGTEVRCPQCKDTFPVPALGVGPDAPTGTPPTPTAPDSDAGGEVTTEAGARRRPSRITDEPSAPRDRDRHYPGGDEDYPRPPRGEYDDREAEAPLSNRYEIDLGRWFSIASAHYTAILGPAVGFTAMWMAVYVGLSFIGGIMGAVVITATGVPGTDTILGMLSGAFVIQPLLAGLYLVCLKQLDGRAWNFGDFFAGFSGRYYVNLIVLGLLTQLLFLPAIAPSLLGNILMHRGGQPEVGLGLSCLSLVLLIAVVFFYVRLFYLALPLMLDRRMKPIDAIKGSWALTEGHFWPWLGISILLGLIGGGGFCLLCVGGLFSLPYAFLVQMAGYMDVAGVNPPLPTPDHARRYRDREYD